MVAVDFKLESIWAVQFRTVAISSVGSTCARGSEQGLSALSVSPRLAPSAWRTCWLRFLSRSASGQLRRLTRFSKIILMHARASASHAVSIIDPSLAKSSK